MIEKVKGEFGNCVCFPRSQVSLNKEKSKLNSNKFSGTLNRLQKFKRQNILEAAFLCVHVCMRFATNPITPGASYQCSNQI